MNAKLIVEGKEFDIQIMDPELQKLIKPPKKNGYERAHHDRYWFDNLDGSVDNELDDATSVDDEMYEYANYYSDKTVAENNARADTLMRKLRRFAVEHREKEFDWNTSEYKWYIGYYYRSNELSVYNCCTAKSAGVIYFDSKATAELAITTFRDELTWLFTEYKDSL